MRRSFLRSSDKIMVWFVEQTQKNIPERSGPTSCYLLFAAHTSWPRNTTPFMVFISILANNGIFLGNMLCYEDIRPMTV